MSEIGDTAIPLNYSSYVVTVACTAEVHMWLLAVSKLCQHEQLSCCNHLEPHPQGH